MSSVFTQKYVTCAMCLVSWVTHAPFELHLPIAWQLLPQDFPSKGGWVSWAGVLSSPKLISVNLICSFRIPTSVRARRKMSFCGNQTSILLHPTLQLSSLLALFSCTPCPPSFPFCSLVFTSLSLSPLPPSPLALPFETFPTHAPQVSALTSPYRAVYVRLRCDKSGEGNPETPSGHADKTQQDCGMMQDHRRGGSVCVWRWDCDVTSTPRPPLAYVSREGGILHSLDPKLDV